MAMSDPFSTTYQGTMQAKESLGQGITDAATGIGAGIVGAAQQKQQQAQLQKMMGLIGMGNQTGAINNETVPLTPDEYNTQAEALIAKAGPSLFKNNTVLTGSSDPTERMQQYQALFKAAGIPGPKTTKTTTTVDADKLTQAQKMGWSWSPKDGVTFHSTEVSPETQAMQELNLESKKAGIEKEVVDTAKTIDTSVNPDVAPTRSVLGLLGQTTVRAQRALDILADPNITKSSQVLAAVGSDMAGILQGGSPTQQGMSEQNYDTVTSLYAKLQQFAQSNPEDAVPPAIMDQLKETFNVLNKTGKEFIQNNINSTAAVQSDWIKDHPDEWKALIDNVNQQYGLDDSSSGGSSSNSAKSVLSAAGIGNNNQQSKWSLVGSN